MIHLPPLLDALIIILIIIIALDVVLRRFHKNDVTDIDQKLLQLGYVLEEKIDKLQKQVESNTVRIDALKKLEGIIK